jgi:hypothetical protein
MKMRNKHFEYKLNVPLTLVAMEKSDRESRKNLDLKFILYFPL